MSSTKVSKAELKEEQRLKKDAEKKEKVRLKEVQLEKQKVEKQRKKEEAEQQGRSRAWCLTIFDEEEYKRFIDHESQYLVSGLETCPETGRKHYQSFVYYINQVTFSSIKKRFATAHIEKMISNCRSSSLYCKKGEQSKEEWNSLKELGPNYGKNASFFESGCCPSQGERTDLQNVRDQLQKTGKMSDVVNIATSYQSVKMAEYILKYTEPKRKRCPEIYWFYGPTGMGKSTRVDAVCNPDIRYMAPRKGSTWWEGYDGHTLIFIDDFRPDFMPLRELLQFFDGREFRIECKGGSRQFLGEKIYITSPDHPSHYYGCLGEDIKQLIRRIDEIIWVTSWDTDTDRKEYPKKEFIEANTIL